ncbi:hypothetical protein MMC11_009060 [Xylographa trunciseda]|nr:hypothetical protein [Xylographa trunciseda]
MVPDDGLQVVPFSDATYGKEVVPHEQSSATQKQIVVAKEEKEAIDPLAFHGEPPVGLSNIHNQPQKPSRKPRLLAIIIILVVIAIAVIAAVVTVIEVRNRQSAQSQSVAPNLPTTPAPTMTSSAGPSPSNTPIGVENNATNSNSSSPLLSTYGAFNSSGLLTMDPSDGTDQLLLFWQHYNGDLIFSQLLNNAWQTSALGSGNILGVQGVANGTSLGGTSYVLNNVLTWSVFYIDNTSTIQNVYKNNLTNAWTTGSIGSQNFKASSQPGAALSVYWSALWAGSIPGQSGGLVLFAGGLDGLVHEYTWSADGNDTWNRGFIFPSTNGFAGAASWPGGGTTNLYLQNSANALEVWWKDFNTEQTNTSTHPVGIWNRGPAAVVQVRTNSSMAFSNNLYFQESSNQILGIAPNGSAENLSWGPAFVVTAQSAMLGTSIACQTFFPSTTGPSGIHVYFQTNGTDIIEYIRGQEGGQWAFDDIPTGG